MDGKESREGGLDLEALLLDIGFAQEEIESAVYELDQYREIPGTTLQRYLRRIFSAVGEEGRPALLRGIIAGTAFRLAILKAVQEDLEIREEVAREMNFDPKR